ncbi:PilZ domain-containing protein [Sphingomonas sp.]|uniref:PilZ domain-containing protein n=1 Tax=Sphingomonas sp. TaxID=28214 RepID=UPI003B00F51B
MDGIDRVQFGPVDETPDTVSGDGGKRQRKRDSLFLSARLSLDGVRGEHEVRVRNLSAGGLMAELDRSVAPGTAATLEMRGLGELTGRVAWCAHGRMGIALDNPIDPSRARTSVGGGKRTPGYAKPLIVAGRHG